MTRLYTAVNFLQPANIKLMDKASNGTIAIVKHFVGLQDKN